MGFEYKCHSSEIRALRSTLCPRETLQNLPYLMYKITPCSFFRFSFRATLYFYPKKNYMGFLIHNIYQILKRFARSFHQEA